MNRFSNIRVLTFGSTGGISNPDGDNDVEKIQCTDVILCEYTSVSRMRKAVNKMDAEAPDPVLVESVWRFSIPSSEPLGRPIIAINDVTFDYNLEWLDGTKKTEDEFLLQKVNFGVDNSSKIAILGANGQVCKKKNGRRQVQYFIFLPVLIYDFLFFRRGKQLF